MSTATINEPATLSCAGKPAHPSFAEWAKKGADIVRAKPSKQVMAELWAKASGIINTGETDLSTREGLGY